MLRKLSTISFYADDLAAAKIWYTDILGEEPYFEVPGYFEFRVGEHGHELGVIDRRFAPTPSADPAGAVVYWHVEDLPAAVARLNALGAKEYQPITPRGDSGYVTVSFVDPFGNILGLIHNPNYAA
jgi:predicted enzyme related to lactoylglutathione lyase